MYTYFKKYKVQEDFLDKKFDDKLVAEEIFLLVVFP